MEEKQQWLSIAAVVLVILGLGFFLYRQGKQDDQVQLVDETEQAEQKAEEVLKSMNVTVPDDAEKATLKDVVGEGGAGVVTRREENGKVEHSFLAALPEPKDGEFYEGYLVSEAEGEEKVTYAGKLREAKGGWLLEYDTTDSQVANKVRITKEKVDDKQPEQTVLEGDFK